MTPALKNITWVMMDVDGVLTDGTIIITDEGTEAKGFHSHDGVGIKCLLRAGLKTAIITGRRSPAAEIRAKELGMTEVVQGAKDKLVAYEALTSKYELTEEQVAYVGDDLTDLPVLRRVGFAVCVCEAPEEVKSVCDYVTSRPGGRGAIREVAELILKTQGRWENLLERYETK